MSVAFATATAIKLNYNHKTREYDVVTHNGTVSEVIGLIHYGWFVVEDSAEVRAKFFDNLSRGGSGYPEKKNKALLNWLSTQI